MKNFGQTKVYIQDKMEMRRTGLREWIKSKSDFDLIGETSDLKKTVSDLGREEIDLLIIDSGSFLAMTSNHMKRIKTKSKNVKILTLCDSETMHLNDIIINGSDSVICIYRSTFAEFESAINVLLKGNKYFPNYILEKLPEIIAHKTDLNNLTIREKEILVLVAEGLSNKMIASKLDISSRTVEVHRHNIMKKMDVNNTAEMIYKANKQNLIPEN